MPFIDTHSLNVIERLPGWYGRYFHSENMTFAHYDFKRGSTIHEHFHPQEEVYEVIEGELEVTIEGVARIMKPGWSRLCRAMFAIRSKPSPMAGRSLSIIRTDLKSSGRIRSRHCGRVFARPQWLSDSRSDIMVAIIVGPMSANACFRQRSHEI